MVEADTKAGPWNTQLLIELQLRLLIGQIETGFSFGHAVGVQLDFLGESVSIPRREGWDDETYRSVLLRRLKLWTWDGTNETCRLFFLMGKTCRITTTVRLQLYAGKTPVLHESERYRCREAELIRKRCQVLNGSHALCSGCKYYQERGWADYEDRANLENVWQQYHALGAMET